VDLIAANIREVAAESRVPLLAAPPLARALYHSTKLDHEIPAGLYTAVAQVLAYIYQLKDVRYWGGTPPPPPKNFEIPDEFVQEE
jgi:flagellar biosynthetic protein FlhB